jgi:hypothetical protein
MAANLSLHYDDVGDVLYIDTVVPYAEQESEHIADDVVARLNPSTGAIENLEVLFYQERIRRGERLDLPVLAELRPAG